MRSRRALWTHGMRPRSAVAPRACSPPLPRLDSPIAPPRLGPVGQPTCLEPHPNTFLSPLHRPPSSSRVLWGQLRPTLGGLAMIYGHLLKSCLPHFCVHSIQRLAPKRELSQEAEQGPWRVTWQPAITLQTVSLPPGESTSQCPSTHKKPHLC